MGVGVGRLRVRAGFPIIIAFGVPDVIRDLLLLVREAPDHVRGVMCLVSSALIYE